MLYRIEPGATTPATITGQNLAKAHRTPRQRARAAARWVRVAAKTNGHHDHN